MHRGTLIGECEIKHVVLVTLEIMPKVKEAPRMGSGVAEEVWGPPGQTPATRGRGAAMPPLLCCRGPGGSGGYKKEIILPNSEK